MKLSEVFARFINDEFSPKLVFAIVNGVPKSIELAQLNRYYSYKYTGMDASFNLPVLV